MMKKRRPAAYLVAVQLSFGTVARPLRAHADELFAVIFALLWLTGVVGGSVPSRRWDLTVFAVCGVLITAPFAWRRSAPVLVALVVYSAGTALAFSRSIDLPIGFVVASLVAGYSLGAYSRGRRSWVTLVVVLAEVGAANVPHNDSGIAGVILTPTAFLIVPWALGRLVARLRSERGTLHQMNVRLEVEQQEVARASVFEERSRIARELHDIVAHSISVMVIQAGAAEQFIDPASEARAPLAAIRTTGQEALVEMRHLLGILRTDDPEQLSLAPQPGMASLSSLVDAARQSGLEVPLTIEGQQVPLPPGVDIAAFRLIQESFSNVRKHSGARSVALTLRYEPSCLTIDVADDGVGAERLTVDPGHGLIGMRERVSLYGGKLECGPRAGGGWRVWARLPVTG